MNRTYPGIHHVTAIASDAQANVDFWAGLLGLRKVKTTVNFDDPLAYHLYYGDTTGSPGTILTFFPYKRARSGTRGRGQAAAVSLAIPAGTLDFWGKRLAAHDVPFEAQTRFGESLLSFEDPDGLAVELVESEQSATPWAHGGIAREHAIHGVHSVTLWVPQVEPTAKVLETLGFARSDEDHGRWRYRTDAIIGRFVDLRPIGSQPGGVGGAGTIHHVAFRAADDADELRLRQAVTDLGLRPTEVIDRDYFHSVYFREPGGVLFEIATDPPGFATDEPADSLGEELRVPAQHRPKLDEIRANIDPLRPATTGQAPVFIHRFEPGESRRTLLMLHGTGGDEFDLLPLASKLDASASVLSPRGRVNEGGMPRFFRRLAEGVFDEESVRRQSAALTNWLSATAERYGLDATAVDAVGYSNGANIASAALLARPEALRSLVLLRPMVPLREPPDVDLAGKRVLLLAGERDPIAPPAEVDRLRELLETRGAAVTLRTLDAGHELTGEDFEVAREFLA
jgi:predicted esterase/catechol 2,3-dioxygenase-like lactoylglutathione lyase family enzyme